MTENTTQIIINRYPPPKLSSFCSQTINLWKKKVEIFFLLFTLAYSLSPVFTSHKMFIIVEIFTLLKRNIVRVCVCVYFYFNYKNKYSITLAKGKMNNFFSH